MSELKLHVFEFKNFDLAGWSYSNLLRLLPAELSNLSRRTHKAVLEEAQVGSVLLSISSPTTAAMVTLVENAGALQVGCTCGGQDGKLCAFQVQGILNLLENQAVNVFFDPAKRQVLFIEAARNFGLEDSDSLETQFELTLHRHLPTVRPLNPHWQPADKTHLRELADRLTPHQPTPPDWKPDAVKILVWTQSRFQDNFQLSVYEAFQAANGQIKGSLKQLHAVDLLLESDTTEQLKFYGAVAKFQETYRNNAQVTDMQAFYWILKNPDHLPVYLHTYSISETVTPQALRQVEMVTKELEMEVTVHQTGDFFEISGLLTIEGKHFDLLETRLRYGNFLLAGERLHLIEREGFKELLHYLQQHRNKVILHRRMYESFRKEVLEKVEAYTRVIYTYLKPATKKQRKALELDLPPEKMVYLDDAGQYVHITPVMRYGSVEMPVLSPRVLYMVDDDGRPFRMERAAKEEIEFATTIMMAHPGFPEQMGNDYVYLHKLKFFDDNWFLKTFEAWRKEGFAIYGYSRIKNNNLSEFTATTNVSVISGIDWFETKVDVRFGKETVPLRQLFISVRNKTRYVALSNGTFGILPEEFLEKLAGYFRIGFAKNELLVTPRQHYAELRSLYPDEYLSPSVKEEIKAISAQLEGVTEIPEITIPQGLRTTLRDYQYEGVKWLAFMNSLKFGACLADDMGLGKTIQVIAFLLLEKERLPGGTSLIVAPASLLFNWQIELKKHAPDLNFAVYYGEGRKMTTEDQQEYDVVLTTYSVMVAEIHRLKANHYHYIVLDESQNIKNPTSQRHRAACQLRSDNRIIITGTPVENNTMDLYGQFSFVCPGLLGSRRYFKDQYYTPIDKFRESRKIEELHRRIRPFMLRRTKEQVSEQLPEKTEMVIYCEMGEAQRRVYDAYASEFRAYLAGRSDGDIAREKLHILQGLTKLRQICISPSILNDEEYYGGESSKITVLLEQLEAITGNHKVLVFSQFVTVLDLVKAELEKRKIGYSYLTGSTTGRGAVVEEFQNEKSKRVFLISLKAGGTGLNLTAADYVFLMDPWWNPAVENQAIDRVHRIGQHKAVVATRLVCPDTIEERVMQLQQKKKELTDELIQEEDSIVKELDKRAILGIV